MNAPSKLRLAFYGDDFTGSTDAMEALVQAGLPTVLFLEPPAPEVLARYPGLAAIGVAGWTRSLAPDALAAQLRPALTALGALGVPFVHYKVCSTFDSSPEVGSIGRAIDVAGEVFPPQVVPLLVGAPALGRYCAFGNLFARLGGEGGIFRLDRHPSMSRHPVTPADESDLRRHLARQTNKRLGLFDLRQLEQPEPEARAALAAIVAEGAEVVLFDLLYERQLARLGGLIESLATAESPLFVVGSSGVEMALGAHWQAEGTVQPVTAWRDPGPAQPLLVVSGSCSPVTAGQVRNALAGGFAEVVIDAASLAQGEAGGEAEPGAAAEVVAHLQAGRHVMAHTGSATETVPPAALGTLFARMIRTAVEQTGLHRLVVAGGDTASHTARSLEIEALEMIAPLAPGAPLCAVRAPGRPLDGLEINFKGGQVGNEDYFAAVARGHL